MTDLPVLASSVALRPAATVMLVRDGQAGLEVFMLQRSHSSAFARSSYVFPGGRVDDADSATGYEQISDGVTDELVSQRLGVDSGGLAWLVAAIRECFEEAGVLLARRTSDKQVISFDAPEVAARFNEVRHLVHDGSLSLAQLCADEDLQLLTDRIFLVDHWITPVGEPRRFDTRFFLTRAPVEQEPLHDDSETIASLWTTPTDALAKLEAGELRMLPPTIASLRWLGDFTDADAAITTGQKVGIPTPIAPKLLFDENYRVSGIVRQDEPEYDSTPLPKYIIDRA